ncbi:hypothetical protein P9112_011417 [Eukaryota sp. TZLM1-RC]
MSLPLQHDDTIIIPMRSGVRRKFILGVSTYVFLILSIILCFSLIIMYAKNSHDPGLADFLDFAGSDYGYNGQISSIRKIYFPQLKDQTYLDYTAAGIPTSTVASHARRTLSNQIFTNPHSGSQRHVIEEQRKFVSDFFNAKDYEFVFTSGTTNSLELIARDFSLKMCQFSRFFYSIDNHLSVLGMRSYFNNSNWQGLEFNSLLDSVLKRNEFLYRNELLNVENMIVIPAQSNFDGTVFDYHDLFQRIEKDCLEKGVKKWTFVLDAAAYVSTHSLDLNTHNYIDYIPLSFYKIIGYPTGVGGFFVRKTLLPTFERGYFGGGSVVLALPENDVIIERGNDVQRIETGTVSFTDIQFLTTAFDLINTLGMDVIEKHVQSLVKWTVEKMTSLTHQNGQPLIKIYGPHSPKRGSTIAFSILDDTGHVISPSTVSSKAALAGVLFRTGSMCNHGAFMSNLGISEEELLKYITAGCECVPDFCRHFDVSANDSGDPCLPDFLDGGQPNAVHRISFGYPSSYQDVVAFLKFLEIFSG